jgi:ribosome maturation factor RimP
MLQEEKKIFSLLSDPLKIAGLELIEVKIGLMNTKKTIQLYIDSLNGIQLDDCVNANQITKNIFDKTNQFYKGCVLEVSSPGIFRKLKTPDHFKSSTGKRIKVHLNKKIEGLKTVTGDLQKCDDSTICIQQDTNGPDMIIPYSLISSANLEPLLKL